MIVLGSQDNINLNNMFDEESYKKAHYFTYDDYDSAIDFVYRQIKYMFKDRLHYQKHFNFDTYKSMDDLRRIQLDAENLDYSDYYKLATFVDNDENYSCDLIIMKGKMGLRFNKQTDNNLENLSFQAYDINLDNEVSLMLFMKEKLDDFINKQLVEEIEKDMESIHI